MGKLPHQISWRPNLKNTEGPLYLAIADALESDIGKGVLKSGARLPAQRALAQTLGIDFTTVTRAYDEARKRALVEGRVGHGTYVRAKAKSSAAPASRVIDVSMNLPPRFRDRTVESRMEAGLGDVAAEGLDLFLTYQDPAGAIADREAGAAWLASRLPDCAPERLLVCPGAQGALAAALNVLTQKGDTVCAESLTFPGFTALAAHLGLTVVAVAMDKDGLLPDSFEQVCKDHKPKLLYCTPTFHNPTTATIPLARRKRLVEIAKRYDVRIVEDDAYGALPQSPLAPLAALAPGAVWHIAGLAKCLSPALRIAYLVAPDTRAAARAAIAVRAFSGMASPITAALATRWIADGTADAALNAIRRETALRQQAASQILPVAITHPECFHAWVQLPEGWTANALSARARRQGVSLVTADAFAIGTAPEAVRIGLGAARDVGELSEGLEILADLLARPPGSSSTVV